MTDVLKSLLDILDQNKQIGKAKGDGYKARAVRSRSKKRTSTGGNISDAEVRRRTAAARKINVAAHKLARGGTDLSAVSAKVTGKTNKKGKKSKIRSAIGSEGTDAEKKKLKRQDRSRAAVNIRGRVGSGKKGKKGAAKLRQAVTGKRQTTTEAERKRNAKASKDRKSKKDRANLMGGKSKYRNPEKKVRQGGGGKVGINESSIGAGSATALLGGTSRKHSRSKKEVTIANRALRSLGSKLQSNRPVVPKSTGKPQQKIIRGQTFTPATTKTPTPRDAKGKVKKSLDHISGVLSAFKILTKQGRAETGFQTRVQGGVGSVVGQKKQEGRIRSKPIVKPMKGRHLKLVNTIDDPTTLKSLKIMKSIFEQYYVQKKTDIRGNETTPVKQGVKGLKQHAYSSKPIGNKKDDEKVLSS